MAETEPAPRFELTTRQRRLRTLTLIILAVVLVMIGFALFHPFFHPVRPPILTPRIRRALAVQGIMILGYVGIIFLLALSLLIIAWLYARDVRMQLAMAQRDLWRGIAETQREAGKLRRNKRPGDGRNGPGK